MAKTKHCYRCGLDLPLERFTSQRSKYVRSSCKSCRLQDVQAWMRRNPDKHKQACAQYYQEHKQDIAKYYRERYARKHSTFAKVSGGMSE